MKCKVKFIKMFALLTLGLAALNLSLTRMDKAVTYNELERNSLYCIPHNAPAVPGEMLRISDYNRPSEPLDRVFQIIFILFFISPPLIVILLFLIWRELKAKNRMK